MADFKLVPFSFEVQSFLLNLWEDSPVSQAARPSLCSSLAFLAKKKLKKKKRRGSTISARGKKRWHWKVQPDIQLQGWFNLNCVALWVICQLKGRGVNRLSHHRGSKASPTRFQPESQGDPVRAASCSGSLCVAPPFSPSAQAKPRADMCDLHCGEKFFLPPSLFISKESRPQRGCASHFDVCLFFMLSSRSHC